MLHPLMRNLNYWACKSQKVCKIPSFILALYIILMTFDSSMANVFIVAPESLSTLFEGTPSIRKDAQRYKDI